MGKKIKKFLKLSFIVFFVTIVLAYLFTLDISEHKLGPSPIIVENSHTSEDNIEFQEIIRLNNAIQGYEEFNNIYELDLNNPEPSIELLKEFIQKNQLVIEKATPELFQFCKLPSPIENGNLRENISYSDLLSLLQLNITFTILVNDFNNAEKKIFEANRINKYLENKSTGFLSGLSIVSSKIKELENIKLLINSAHYSMEQKLAILSLNQEGFSSQFLKRIAHYDSIYIKEFILNMKISSSKELDINKKFYFPIITPYQFQPNKSVKLYREASSRAISNFEIGTFDSYKKNEEKMPYNSLLSLLYIEPNQYGFEFYYKLAHFFKHLVNRTLSSNNTCKQLNLAKEILLFKTKNGSLPEKLIDLGLEKEMYTDIHSGAPFLYSAQNGILLGIGGDQENNNANLTTTTLTEEEIKKSLKSTPGSYKSDFILYLK
jgi:hypothetical protein